MAFSKAFSGETTLRKIVSVLLASAAIPFAAVSSPAQAGDGSAIAAGVLGGLAAGTIVGIAAPMGHRRRCMSAAIGLAVPHIGMDTVGSIRASGCASSHPKLVLRPYQQVRQPCDINGDAPRTRPTYQCGSYSPARSYFAGSRPTMRFSSIRHGAETSFGPFEDVLICQFERP